MTSARKNAEAPVLSRRWRAALAHAGLTQAGWARQYGWTEQHVSQVVLQRRESAPVTAKVLAFIREQEQAIAARVGEDAL